MGFDQNQGARPSLRRFLHTNSMKECIMDTGGILFLVLIFAAAGVFAATLAYYSRG
jgi:hypothetical protein